MSKIAASAARIVSVLFCQNRNWDDEFASFSARKLSLVLEELPLASLVSNVISNFFVGLSGRRDFVPPGLS